MIQIPRRLKLWKIINVSRNFSTLPRLPVPPLKSTLQKLLLSARPFLTEQEFCDAECVINEFGEPNGIGEYLQCMLIERAKQKENWMKDWWEQVSFLCPRTPLPIPSSVAFTFPRQEMKNDEEMLDYAAKIVDGALQFKAFLDENKISRETYGDFPLDMSQYATVFGTTRIPCCPVDYVIAEPESEHIVVMLKNHFYMVKVKENGRWLRQHAILQQLKEVMAEGSIGPPVGVLTTNCRDVWNIAYDQLRKSKINSDTLKMIEESLFLLCLDTVTPPKDVNWATTALHQCLHGGGVRYNGANRWFDKTIQVIVGRNGISGVCLEPSLAEVDIVLGIMSFIQKKMSKPVGVIPTVQIPLKLYFEIDECTAKSIKSAEEVFEKSVMDLDLVCIKFGSFGRNMLRSLNISPDSFVQVAIQLTNYKITGGIWPQFEVVTSRRFQQGRSEVVRSTTEATVRFLRAICEEKPSKSVVAGTLVAAIGSHIQLVTEALNGQGIDRHLFGLKMITQEANMEVPKIFKHPVFTKSSSVRLYTGNVSTSFDGYMTAAPKCNDGYSCFYNIRSEEINFAISAYSSSMSTNVTLFAETLKVMLMKMVNLAEQLPASGWQG